MCGAFEMMQALNKTIVISGTGAAGQGGALISSAATGSFTSTFNLKLAANASVGGAERVDVRGTSATTQATFDMQGFNLITNNATQFSLTHANVLNPGNIDVKAGAIAIEETTQLNGSGSNTLTLENGTTYQDWNSNQTQNWGLITIGNTSLNNQNNVTTNTNIWNGTVQLGGNLAINPGNANGIAAITIGGNISGTGSVQVTDPGRLTLSGTNTYSGTTLVGSSGILIAASPWRFPVPTCWVTSPSLAARP